MSYILLLIFIAAGPLLLGYWRSRAINTWCAARPRVSSVIIIGGALAWLALAYGARTYADCDAPGWAVAEWFAHTGKWPLFAAGALFMLGAALGAHPPARTRVATALLVELLVIWLLIWQTLPSYVWLPRTSPRDADGHLRQSIETTCGPVSLGNLLETAFHRPAPSERELARLAHTTAAGTTLQNLITAARALGLDLETCQVMSMAELRHLNRPAVVLISTLPEVKHATLLLQLGEHDAEFIDPAYGRQRIPLARFEKIWYGKTLVFNDRR